MLHKSPCVITKHSKKLKILITSIMMENVSISKELDKQKQIGTHETVPHLNTYRVIRLRRTFLVSCFSFPLVENWLVFSTSECELWSMGNEVMNLNHFQEMICNSDKLQSKFLKTCVCKCP